MGAHRRLDRILALAVALVVLTAGAPAYAQIFGEDRTFWSPDSTTTTTTTTPATTTTTTTAPPPAVLGAEPGPAPSGPAPEPTEPPPPSEAPPPGQAPPPGDEAPPADGGDSTASEPSSGGIPAAAQAIIDSIQRSPANGSRALLDAVRRQLVPLGLSEQEAIRVGFGRFPIAGAANFVHDWYFPRWGPGFRFHKGTDVFADHGTPVRSPVDGTVTSGNGSLGGLFVKVFQPDGTYFYMAHLSGLPEGFQEGMAVQTGDIVGFVGNSGNARTTPPHVHLGIYSPGGEATDPKPILDQMLAEALANLPAVVEQVKAELGTAPVADAAGSAGPAPRVPRSLLASSLLRSLIDERAAGSLDTAMLLEAVGNPSSGGLAVAEAEASQLAASIDWGAREARTRIQRLLTERATQLFRAALGPLG
jgi:murein DD-endopeptidase MepM/ murein hydrolase activator NlpD